jgi:hypothetical protein
MRIVTNLLLEQQQTKFRLCRLPGTGSGKEGLASGKPSSFGDLSFHNSELLSAGRGIWLRPNNLLGVTAASLLRISLGGDRRGVAPVNPSPARH